MNCRRFLYYWSIKNLPWAKHFWATTNTNTTKKIFL